MNRRKFIQMMTAAPLALDPVRVLINGLVEGIISEARAAETGAIPPRALIQISSFGAPSRYTFDHLLMPYETYSIRHHPNVKTAFNQGSQTNYSAADLAYLTYNYKGVNFPHLWGLNVPNSAGTPEPFSKLADNMVIIRGVDQRSDGHTLNYYKITAPVPGAPSLNGLLADVSQALVPAVAAPAATLTDPYRSARGIGIARIGTGTNPLSQILEPFVRTTATNNANYLSRRAAVEFAMNTALDSLASYVSSGAPGSATLSKMRTHAESRLKQGIGDIATTFTALYNKYLKIQKKILASNFAGVRDKSIPFDMANRELFVTTPIFSYCNQNAEAMFVLGDPNSTSLISGETINTSFASNMAVIEYLIVNGLSQAIAINMGLLSNLRFPAANMRDYEPGTANDNAPLSTNGGLSLDEHSVGGIIQLLNGTYMYAILGASIREFIDVLKTTPSAIGGNLFDQTVIEYATEFARKPTAQGIGSDHNPYGNVYSIWNGRIQGPLVLGNCARGKGTSGSNTILADYGYYAPVEGVSSVARPIEVADVAATLAHLLRIKSPTTRNSTLLSESNGVVQPTISKAKDFA